MTAPLPVWRGRVLAVLGIVLAAASLRSAVASLSPLIDRIAADFPLPSAAVGLIGTAPPVCFAVFGLLTPMLTRRLGLERLLIVALSAITVGLVLRGLSTDAITLLLATGLIFAGVGMGNILLPPLVKKYFPDRIGVMTTLYSTMMAVSTFLPPLVAVPVADAANWRLSLSLWAVFALAGTIPWILMLIRERGDDAAAAAAVTVPDARAFARLVRLPLAWSIGIVFGTSSMIAYVSFAWLPTIVVDQAGVSAPVAGLLLSLFAFMGFPASLLVPTLVVRFQATRTLSLIAAASGLVGITGLLLAPIPALIWLWVVLLGTAPLLFPLALVLISIRARTPETAVALSSFVQSVGYLGAASFPLIVGLLHDATGSWIGPLLVMAGVLLISVPFGMIAGRRRTVEDEWEAKHGDW
ncbi:CP family cyanate transporter-like MFS transporter [Microbacterium ginsengiterrae]|uniref:CP family cyanate transporter-like MFS transporter n=1 Tax=Microbacterium ginsengiterrae TaxID=546115 RepID=A0A7W9CCF1_9MICO|nr:CP family cyanate transporter-like MFS transporter [Microbacterium ginsengiterrae]